MVKLCTTASHLPERKSWYFRERNQGLEIVKSCSDSFVEKLYIAESWANRPCKHVTSPFDDYEGAVITFKIGWPVLF